MLTGCRLNEILTLRWDDVDRTAGEFRLRDGKTGTRMVPLTPTAEAVLAGIRRVPINPWVIVGKQPGPSPHHHRRVVSAPRPRRPRRRAHPRPPPQLRERARSPPARASP